MAGRSGKVRKILAIIAFVLLNGSMFGGTRVYAAEENDFSIEIHLGNIGTPMKDVSFAVYEMEDEVEEGLTAMEQEELALTFAERFVGKEVPIAKVKTNASGELVIRALEKGTYLIVQSDEKEYGKVSPFFIIVPREIDGLLENNVVVKAKGERPGIDTGDRENVLCYITMLIGSLSVLLYSLRRGKRRKQVVAGVLACILCGFQVLPMTAEAEEVIPEWATNVVIENPPDDQYVYQFSDACPLYQRGQYRFGCGYYNCAPSPIILLIDGSKYNEASGQTWTANELEFVPGVSNYELTYCADFDTDTHADQFYKKVNVEDSTYFESVTDAYKLRAIVGNTYPFVSAVDMARKLYAENVITNESILLHGKTFADELTTADIDVGQFIAASQMAIWVVCNDTMNSASVTAGSHVYYTLHPENTSMQPTGKLNQVKGYPNADDEAVTTYPMTEEQAENINAIYHYLMNLEPITEEEADQLQQLVITDLDYEATKTGLGNYNVKLKILLNTAIKKNDNITIKVSASMPDGSGTPIEVEKTFVSQGSNEVIGKEVSMDLSEVPVGAEISIELSGEQYLNQGVYFYEPYLREGENERTSSQNMVGASVGYTPVKARASFNIDDVDESVPVMPSTGSRGVFSVYSTGTTILLSGFCFHRKVSKYKSARRKERGIL